MVQPNRNPASPRAQKWLRAAILIIGTITFLCFLALSPILRTFTKEDRISSPLQVGRGTVEQVIPPHIEENAPPIPAQVWVRVHGSLAAAEKVFGSSSLHVGGEAQVSYRVGKSGRIYVDRVEPLPETAPAIKR